MATRKVEPDKYHECCEIISESVRSIIQWSLNEDFRQSCFSLLEVKNSREAGCKVLTELHKVVSLRQSKKLKKTTRKRIQNSDIGSSCPIKLRKVDACKLGETTVDCTTTPKKENNERESYTSNNWEFTDVDITDIENWD